MHLCNHVHTLTSTPILPRLGPATPYGCRRRMLYQGRCELAEMFSTGHVFTLTACLVLAVAAGVGGDGIQGHGGHHAPRLLHGHPGVHVLFRL